MQFVYKTECKVLQKDLRHARTQYLYLFAYYCYTYIQINNLIVMFKKIRFGLEPVFIYFDKYLHSLDVPLDL